MVVFPSWLPFFLQNPQNNATQINAKNARNDKRRNANAKTRDAKRSDKSTKKHEKRSDKGRNTKRKKNKNPAPPFFGNAGFPDFKTIID